MRIRMYRTITEALGFAVHRFDTMARVAWLPSLLIILYNLALPYVLVSFVSGEVVTVNDYTPARLNELLVNSQAALWSEHTVTMIATVAISYVFQMLMYASFFVPMLLLSTRGIEPSHRSAVLHIGPRHLKFLGTSLAAFFLVYVVLWGPVALSVWFIGQHVSEAMATQVAVFPDPDSLHTVEIRQKMSDPSLFAGFAGLLQIVGSIVIVYVSLRFLWMLFFATVRERGDSYNSLKASLSVSAGWNALKLLLVVFVLLLFAVGISILLNVYVYPLTLSALNGMYLLVLSTFNVMAELGTENQPLMRFLIWLWAVVEIVFNMAWMFFFFGLLCGLGGSIYRQYHENAGT